tara:strand:- start:95 stop:859 length:765 start_codon:yes stop_codon:yes gene_type:complete
MECITTWLKGWFESASEEAIAYLAAISIFIIAIITKKVGFEDAFGVLSWVASVLMVYGLFIYLTPRLVALWDSILGKVILTIVTFIGTNLCLSLATQVINYSLEVTSAPFVYTQSIVALLIAPMVILAGMVIVLLILFLIFPVLFFGQVGFSIKSFISGIIGRSHDVQDLGVLRLIALIITITVCTISLEKISSYSETVADMTRWYAFNLETDLHSYCQVPDGVRVAYISSDLIVTATENEQGYSFKTTVCQKK